MKTPDSAYLVMYPSDDPLNEPLESFRVNRAFFEYMSAQTYIHKLFAMLPTINVERFVSETLRVENRELDRMVLSFAVTSPFQSILKYAIVKMKLNGEFAISYGKDSPSVTNILTEVLHTLDYDPTQHRPKTEYDSIHSVHASVSSLLDTADSLVDRQNLDWHRPFGHATDHMYSPYVDKEGNTKYLVMSSHRLL